jgi:hypothetical protein
MLERRPGIPPHTWPQQLPPPHDPTLPWAVIAWIREILPAEEWRVDTLSRHPWELATMGMTAVDRMVESLRESHRETVRLYTGILGDDDIRRLLAAHAAEAQRLMVLREQMSEVVDALTAMGAQGIQPK